MKLNKYLFLFLLGFTIVACDQDISNPNAATDQQILNSTDGLIAMVNGMQFRYTAGGASGIYTTISANGLTTNELQILNAGNAELAQLGNGFDNVDPANGVISNLWQSMNLIKADADKILENAPTVIQDSDTRGDVVGAASFYKALALGTLAQFWEQAPLNTEDNATFSSRDAALQEAVRLLGDAVSQISGSLSSAFTSAIGSDIDFANAANALSARYQLMLGDFSGALSTANAVNLSSSSVFRFDNVTPNPVFRSSLITQNVYDVNPDFGLSGDLAPDANDGRIDFYLTPNANSGKGFFTSDDASIPVFIPGEIMLIKAEALARQGNMADAVTELNKVLTKTDDLYGVNAGLPAYSGEMTSEAILQEIFKNRAIELYMSGMKLEDSRRFGRPGPNDSNPERNRNFYPYPVRERDNNPNTPPDPGI